MHKRLPPLSSLRAFEAAARHLSFRRAADELNVTPAAISHQVKALEEYLGVKLFRRLVRGLELTGTAQACMGKLRDGFDALATAVEMMRTHDTGGTLDLGIAPSLAVKWLMPRIHSFVSTYPDIDVRIAASSGMIDGRRDPSGHRANIDSDEPHVEIRFGAGQYPGFRVDKLFSVSVMPMCSPRLLDSEHPLERPEHLRHHTLLHHDAGYAGDGGSSWKQWLKAAGVEGVDVSRGPHFNHAVLALDAAIDGAGVVLSYPVLAAADLAAKKLVTPFPLSLPMEQAYHLVCAEVISDHPRVAAFRGWLFEEARKESAVPI
jgi:LysR family transcriptional regulator, glycine cleavage system transcriptional activator